LPGLEVKLNTTDALFSNAGKKLWIRYSDTKELLLKNPFYIKGASVYDAEHKIRDDIVGLYCRGRICIKAEDSITIEKGMHYWYYSFPDMRYGRRTFRGYGLDYLNYLVGNVYLSEAEAVADKKRIGSVFRALSTMKEPPIKATIRDAEVFLKDLETASKRQEDLEPVDSDYPEDTKERGVLRKIAADAEESAESSIN
jgi:hypothetical protein